MSVDLFYEFDDDSGACRWVARCGHCGGPITRADAQADLEAILAVLGVDPAGAPALDVSDDLGSVID